VPDMTVLIVVDVVLFVLLVANMAWGAWKGTL
jgi:hypothetical protein